MKKWKTNRDIKDPWYKIDNAHFPFVLMTGALQGPSSYYVTYWYSNGKVKNVKY